MSFRVQNLFASAFLLLLVLFADISPVAARDSDKPPHKQIAKTGRWLMHESLYGSLSTISVDLNGVPFGNVQSVVDGSEDESTGIPYFYVSEMDTSQVNIASNNTVSFALSEAQLQGGCKGVDQEDPTCVRLTLSGKMVEVTNEDELNFATKALFERHPHMEDWPSDHGWKVKKIELENVWILDFYGGVTPITVEEYLSAM